jgi:periplasmic protein TonB
MSGLGPRETAALGALAIHALIMFLVAEVERPDRIEVVDMEMAEEPEPEPEPEKAVEPEPLPEPEPEPEPEKAPPPEPKEAPPREAPPPAEPPPAAVAGPTGEPAPGWAVEAPNADQPYQIGDVPVGQTRAPGGRGKGGTGGGTGTGGGGTGPAASGGDDTVSVAAIKTMPQPIGDTDFVDATRDYPPDARRLGVEGQVKVRLKVDATGMVASRALVTRLGHGLDELALKLAQRLRFKPAIDTADRPVPATVVWTFTFTLPR